MKEKEDWKVRKEEFNQEYKRMMQEYLERLERNKRGEK